MVSIKVEAHIETAMHEKQIPGLALAILRGDEVLYEGYHGHANMEHNIPVSANTVWEIASVTKPFTAQAVLLLANDGLLDIDLPLTTYLSGLPKAWNPVTLRHCLVHQSGIPNYTEADQYWQVTRLDKTHDEVLALVCDMPLKFIPGTRHSYDNTGYYLLGMVLEAVTGKLYSEVIEQLICQPLGMQYTRANDNRAIIPHRAAGYTLVEGRVANQPPYSTSNTFSAGVLVSTLLDLIRWRKSLYPDALLPAQTLAAMLTSHPSAQYNEASHHFTLGLGWFLVEHAYGKFIGHNGSTVGFASTFAHFPQRDLTLISLCNQGQMTPHELVFEVAGLLLPELTQQQH